MTIGMVLVCLKPYHSQQPFFLLVLMHINSFMIRLSQTESAPQSRSTGRNAAIPFGAHLCIHLPQHRPVSCMQLNLDGCDPVPGCTSIDFVNGLRLSALAESCRAFQGIQDC